jgi:hypothetical protein
MRSPTIATLAQCADMELPTTLAFALGETAMAPLCTAVSRTCKLATALDILDLKQVAEHKICLVGSSRGGWWPRCATLGLSARAECSRVST